MKIPMPTPDGRTIQGASATAIFAKLNPLAAYDSRHGLGARDNNKLGEFLRAKLSDGDLAELKKILAEEDDAASNDQSEADKTDQPPKFTGRPERGKGPSDEKRFDPAADSRRPSFLRRQDNDARDSVARVHKLMDGIRVL